MALARCADELRFLVEIHDEHAPRSDRTQLPNLRIRSGVSRLVHDGHGTSLRRGLSSDDAVRFEPVRMQRKPTVLMSTPRGHDLRVNGRPAGMLHVLAIGDQVQLGERVLHLTQFVRPRVGPPPPDVVGAKCPACLVSVTEDASVLMHPQCGAPLHLDPDSIPIETRLECARLGDCPGCDEPVFLEDTYVFVPEL